MSTASSAARAERIMAREHGAIATTRPVSSARLSPTRRPLPRNRLTNSVRHKARQLDVAYSGFEERLNNAAENPKPSPRCFGGIEARTGGDPRARPGVAVGCAWGVYRNARDGIETQLPRRLA